MASTPAAEVLAERIGRHGPRPFSELVAVALYDPDHGFYASGGAAGRRGDFITSVEVGPLFGAVVARALDAWWRELGEPDPFTVVEVGAGIGTLARSVRAAEPACAPALTYVLVEQSAALRQQHLEHLPLTDPSLAQPPAPGPRFVSASTMPAGPIVGVVLANELLDNLPFDLVERRADGWDEVRVGLTAEGELVEVLVPAHDRLVAAASVAGPVEPGARVPLQAAAQDWVRDARSRLERGRVVVLDYADRSPSLASRPVDEWVRTYRDHERGGPPLADLGLQDVTVEVAIDQLERAHPPAVAARQADWLRGFGLDELVDEGRRIWHERAHLGDLAAIKARSRVNEAAALTDPDGLGAFWVLEWTVP